MPSLAPFFRRRARHFIAATVVGCFALLISAASLHAGLFEEGREAYDRKDYRIAMARWSNAARRYDARGLHGMAELHRYALGTPKNEVPVVGLYRRAAALGYAPAQASLAECVQHGLFGATADPAQAIDLAKRAAAQGNRAGVDLLEDAFARGIGVTRDDAEGAFWGLLGLRLLGEEIAALEAKTGRTPLEEEKLTLLRTDTSTRQVTQAMRQRGAGERWPSATQLKEIEQRVAAFRPQPLTPLAGAKEAVAHGERDGAGFLGFAYESGEGVAKDPIESLFWFHVLVRLLPADFGTRPSLQKQVEAETSSLTQRELAGKNAGWLDDAKLAAVKKRAEEFVASQKANAK